VEVNAGGSGGAEGWGRYVVAVAAELAALGKNPIGFDGSVTSDLPIGAGLGSSAALEVAVALALCDAAGFEVDAPRLATALQRAEERAVGVPCGIMDQYASLLGRSGHALLLDCSTLEHRYVPIPPNLSLVVIDSGIERELSSSPYARRRAELENALRALTGRMARGLSLEELDELAPDDVAARRLRHVVTENARVWQTELALRDEDEGALSHLFAASHESLRDDYEVSTPELDAIVEIARSFEVIGARLTGAGFGGSVLMLMREAGAAELAAKIALTYSERTGNEPQVHLCRAADGAQQESGEE
jgi:galactokinase